jgi:hypothetical protein
MGKTIAEILSWVDEVVPNKLNSTTKQIFISDLIGDGDFSKYNTKKTWWDTQTVADQAEYNLPSGVEITDISYVGISPTTYNSTDVTGSTTIYTEHKFKGMTEEKETAYTEYTTQLVIYPTPDDAYHMRIIYKPMYRGSYNASTDTTTLIDADKPLIDWLQNKVAAKVCKSMAFPRIDLGNNYELEAETKLSNAKINYFKKKRATSKTNISYKSWW